MKHKQGKAGGSGGSSSADGGAGKGGSKGGIDREGQIKLGILIRRMYETDLQKPAPQNITDLVKRFDQAEAPADKAEQDDEDERR